MKVLCDVCKVPVEFMAVIKDKDAQMNYCVDCGLIAFALYEAELKPETPYHTSVCGCWTCDRAKRIDNGKKDYITIGYPR